MSMYTKMRRGGGFVRGDFVLHSKKHAALPSMKRYVFSSPEPKAHW